MRRRFAGLRRLLGSGHLSAGGQVDCGMASAGLSGALAGPVVRITPGAAPPTAGLASAVRSGLKAPSSANEAAIGHSASAAAASLRARGAESAGCMQRRGATYARVLRGSSSAGRSMHLSEDGEPTRPMSALRAAAAEFVPAAADAGSCVGALSGNVWHTGCVARFLKAAKSV